MNRYVLGLVLFVTACATAQRGSEGPMTQDEIQASGATTVYDALRVLRPRWLRSTEGGQQLLLTARAGERPPVVDRRCNWRVYVGETGYEGDELRRIQASSVREIRLIILPQRRRPDGSYCVHNYSYIHVVLIDATRDAALNVAQAQQDPKLEELDSLPVGLEVRHAPDPDSHGQRVKGEAVVRHLPELEELKPLGLPTAAQGLQFRRPPLQTKVAEPVARRIYLKLPLQHVRFHWRFMSREDLLSGKLVLRVRRGDLTNEIVIFENGAIAPGWEPISPDGRGPGEIYFGFSSTTTFLTAPHDELEVELLVLKDLAGIGAFQTGVLAAGTYRAKGTYFGLHDDFDSSQPMSAAQMIDSLTEQGVTRDEAEMMAQTLQGVSLAMRMNAEAFSFFASTGCWENLWPLKITSKEGWASPEQVTFSERMLEMEKVGIQGAGGPNCSGPA